MTSSSGVAGRKKQFDYGTGNVGLVWEGTLGRSINNQ